MPNVRVTFYCISFADNFTGSKDTRPYKTDVSFLCQYILELVILGCIDLLTLGIHCACMYVYIRINIIVIIIL